MKLFAYYSKKDTESTGEYDVEDIFEAATLARELTKNHRFQEVRVWIDDSTELIFATLD